MKCDIAKCMFVLYENPITGQGLSWARTNDWPAAMLIDICLFLYNFFYQCLNTPFAFHDSLCNFPFIQVLDKFPMVWTRQKCLNILPITIFFQNPITVGLYSEHELF